jgi:lipopolysaccharide/colanic/teichoic acid biosynthesis glycosyltransferase
VTGRHAAKRLLDLVVAIPLLLVLSPLIAIVAVLVKLTSPGPVFHRQARVGLQGEPFTMLKFRTMVVVDGDDHAALREAIRRELNGEAVAGSSGSFKLDNDPRVTALGRWLRATSIDELPQLVNVVRGEMSLVGPRPSLGWEAEMFPPEYRVRTAVPPGITGLWQVRGRSRLTTLDMLQLDREYVDNWSFWTDVRILVETVPTLVRGDGAR